MPGYPLPVKAETSILDEASPPVSYEQDVAAGAVDRARLIRAGRFELLDREHPADEIEDVGKSEQRELASRIAVLLAHLLKQQHQPDRSGASWERTVREPRKGVLPRLKHSPSLQCMLGDEDWIADIWSDAVTLAVKETGKEITSFPET